MAATWAVLSCVVYGMANPFEATDAVAIGRAASADPAWLNVVEGLPTELLLAGLGGGVGAGLRVWLRSIAVRKMHGTWRVTLGVNALGSILIGVLAAPLVDAPMVRMLLVPGVLGGFTTFSGFALDAVIAIGERRWWRAVTIVLGTLVGCPLLCLTVIRGAGS